MTVVVHFSDPPRCLDLVRNAAAKRTLTTRIIPPPGLAKRTTAGWRVRPPRCEARAPIFPRGRACRIPRRGDLKRPIRPFCQVRRCGDSVEDSHSVEQARLLARRHQMRVRADTRPLNNALKVRDRLVVDGRRLSLAGRRVIFGRFRPVRTVRKRGAMPDQSAPGIGR
jgi:hypothetical protein